MKWLARLSLVLAMATAGLWAFSEFYFDQIVFEVGHYVWLANSAKGEILLAKDYGGQPRNGSGRPAFYARHTDADTAGFLYWYRCFTITYENYPPVGNSVSVAFPHWLVVLLLLVAPSPGGLC